MKNIYERKYLREKNGEALGDWENHQNAIHCSEGEKEKKESGMEASETSVQL